MLSVILPSSPETELTYQWCAEQLKGMEHEIIIAPDWQSGYMIAAGEFISFLEKDCVLSDDYFKSLLKGFNDKANYRKLAMICPAIGANSYTKKVYGYITTPTSIMPSFVKSSSNEYLIQVGYIPGAIIRRSALDNLIMQMDDVVDASANISIYLWNTGKRIVVNPNVLYISKEKQVEIPSNIAWSDLAPGDDVVDIWRKEGVGSAYQISTK